MIVFTHDAPREIEGRVIHAPPRGADLKPPSLLRQMLRVIKERGVLIRTRSFRGVAEEAPGAYKDVSAVAGAAEQANLARRVARLVPEICVKG